MKQLVLLLALILVGFTTSAKSNLNKITKHRSNHSIFTQKSIKNVKQSIKLVEKSKLSSNAKSYFDECLADSQYDVSPEGDLTEINTYVVCGSRPPQISRIEIIFY